MGKKHRNRERRQDRQMYEPAPARQGKTIKYVAAVLALAILVLAATALALGKNDSGSGYNGGSTGYTGGGAAPTVGAGGAQEVRVTMQGYNYQPSPIRVKAGQPVRLVVDLSTVTGCMRSISIPSLGVSKYVREGDNVIEFTPTKAGTFRMQCSMGMGQGTIVVEDATGAAPAAAGVDAEPLVAGSCGGGGGCGGCGG